MNRPADRNHTLILNNTSASCERSKLELHSLGWMDGRGMTHVDITSFSMETDVKGRRGGDGKDGVAAPQARSVARAPRPPSSVQRSCLTELLGSRFAHCAAVGRRGYCRPAASSSAAARGAHGCLGSSMAPHHCVPRMLCPFRSMLRRWQCLQLPPQLLLTFAGTAISSVKRACLDSCLDKTTRLKVQGLKFC